jgi:hypothetical protein
MTGTGTRTETIDKSALHAELVAQLTEALASAVRAHAAAIEGATHAEARAENPKDTRGLEQSYLARGQAARVAELEAGLAAVIALGAVTPLGVRRFAATDPIALGALVTLDEQAGSVAGDAGHGSAAMHLLLAPHGGGSVLAGGVQVVTPRSPLGRAVLGKRLDDEIELQLPGRQRTLIVLAIA